MGAVAEPADVMAGLVPAIHVYAATAGEDVDARQRRQVLRSLRKLDCVAGHDETRVAWR